MKRLLFFVMFVTAWTASKAQALWTSASADFAISKNLTGFVEGEYRTTDNLSATDRWNLTAGISYKFCPYFKMGVNYTFIDKHVASRTTNKGNIVDSYWQPRHRFAVDATGSYRFGKLKLSLRERYQLTHHTEQTVAKYDGDDGERKSDEIVEAKDKHILRSRLKVDYKIAKTIFTPFASVEIYNSLADAFSAEQLRYTIGTDLALSKCQKLNLFYRFIDGRNGDANLNVIGVGFEYSF